MSSSSTLTLVPSSSPAAAEPAAYLQRALYGLTGVFSVSVALVSFRYFVGDFSASPGPPANQYAHPFLFIHIAGAATALLLLPFQFLRAIRQRWPAVHHYTGRVYVLGCMVGGLAGLPIAVGTTAGPVAATGFFMLAVLWLVVNANGWRLAVQGRIPEHKAWMIRSFALTFSAVTLRLIIGLAPAMKLMSFQHAYVMSSWMAWVPNLIVAEWYLHHTPIAAMKAGLGSGFTAEVSGPVEYVKLEMAPSTTGPPPPNGVIITPSKTGEEM